MADRPFSRPLVITAGEPAGIGPDLCLQLAQAGELEGCVLIANQDLLEQRAAELGLKVTFRLYDSDHRITQPAIISLPLGATVQAGQLDPNNAAYVLDTLRRAVEGTLSGEFSGIVTAPVNKAVINDAGIPFSGHTEFFAEACEATPVMMLVTQGLRVALATTHLPLREVPDAITSEGLTRTLQCLHNELLLRFGIAHPKILVCGLNPHAGEGGHLGHEDDKIIAPVIKLLRDQGMDLTGPLPADTLFTPARLEQADAVLAMYHDQGLPVLKYAGFGQAINVTLGLPIIRTSVDHGTALELAGTGRAKPSSLSAAIKLARQLSTD